MLTHQLEIESCAVPMALLERSPPNFSMNEPLRFSPSSRWLWPMPLYRCSHCDQRFWWSCPTHRFHVVRISKPRKHFQRPLPFPKTRRSCTKRGIAVLYNPLNCTFPHGSGIFWLQSTPTHRIVLHFVRSTKLRAIFWSIAAAFSSALPDPRIPLPKHSSDSELNSFLEKWNSQSIELK